MGRSLHNKIYLGRRTALWNMKRVQIAACVTAVSGVALAMLVFKAIH